MMLGVEAARVVVLISGASTVLVASGLWARDVRRVLLWPGGCHFLDEGAKFV